MLLQLLLLIISFASPNQSDDGSEKPLPKEAFQGPSLAILIFAWIFLIIGLIAIVVLVLYTKYGREISIKLSVIAITFASIFLGFSFHFFLINAGY